MTVRRGKKSPFHAPAGALHQNGTAPAGAHHLCPQQTGCIYVPFVPAADTVQVEFRYSWRNIPVETVLYFRVEPPNQVSQMTLNQLGAALKAWHTANIRTRQSEDIILNELYMTDLSTQYSSVATYNQGLPLPGADPAVSVASNQAMCISFRTDGRGRSARGRNFVPGLRASQLVGNNWIAPEAAAIKAGYDALLPAIAGLGWTWVVLSRYTQGLPRPLAVAAAVITTLITTTQVTSQDGRLN